MFTEALVKGVRLFIASRNNQSMYPVMFSAVKRTLTWVIPSIIAKFSTDLWSHGVLKLVHDKY